MAYMHIDNLYKEQRVLMFKQVWATEKIHGTSAWVTYKGDLPKPDLDYHPGGAKMEWFTEQFNHDELLSKCIELFGTSRVKLHGEHYGGKIQKMSKTYGNEHRFVLFDIKIGESFLSFDKVQKLGEKLNLDVVHGVIVDATVEALDRERDEPSFQSKKNGIEEEREREGIVIRPLEEFVSNNGKRVIAKHKGETFLETAHPRKVVSRDRMEVLRESEEIAEEWVTPMRLNHILDKFHDPDIKQTGQVIEAILDDIQREGKGEIEWTPESIKAVGKRASKLFMEFLKSKVK